MKVLSFLLVGFFLLQLQGSVLKEKKLKLGDGSKLLYSISIPLKTDHKKGNPLVIALHWGWDRSKPIPEYFGMSFLTGLILPAFESINPYIVAPDCPSESWITPKSEEALLTLISQIRDHYRIDSTQIIITGFSAGGIGTWYMCSHHPELFSVIIPIASRPQEEWLHELPDNPLYIIQGSDDELFPASEIEALANNLKQVHPETMFIKIEGASHYQTFKYIQPLKDAVERIKKESE